MKHYLTVLIICLTLFTQGNLFAQEARTEDVSSTADAKLFNEGGYVRGITTARAIGLAELVLGIASIVLAIRAGKRTSRRGAKAALIVGGLAVLFSVVHFISVSGAVFGSGSGKAGAIIAAVLGLTGCILSGRILRRP